MISVTPQYSRLSPEQQAIVEAAQIEAPIQTPLVMKAQARRQLVSEKAAPATPVQTSAEDVLRQVYHIYCKTFSINCNIDMTSISHIIFDLLNGSYIWKFPFAFS